MQLIVITHLESVKDEAKILNALFANGLQLLHLRKNDWSAAQTADLLEQIEPQYCGRIALHEHHELASMFGIKYLHFSESNRTALTQKDYEKWRAEGFSLSTSLHSVAELEVYGKMFHYCFLSPVFNSISKEGYVGQLNAFLPLPQVIADVIALGGITANQVPFLAQYGFDGAAVLGWIWSEPETAVDKLNLLKEACVAVDHMH